MLKKYKNDIILISILIFIAIIIFVVIRTSMSDGNYVVVTIDDNVYEVYDISKDTVVSLPTGNELTIQNGNASITQSDCKDKVCINRGMIHSNGETIICLPHKLVIEVQENVHDE